MRWISPWYLVVLAALLVSAACGADPGTGGDAGAIDGRILVRGDAAADARSPLPAGSNGARIEAALSGHTPPFTLAYPGDPVTTSEVTVDPSSLSAGLAAGRRLTLQAGAYGDVNVSVDDVDLIAQAGVTFTSLTVAGHRVRLTGGGGTTVAGFIQIAAGASDLLFDNVRMQGSGMYDTFGLSVGVQRLAVINSSFSTSVSWVLIGGDGGSDIVMARSEFVYTGPTYSPSRFVGVTGLVLAGNRYVTDAQGLRVHNSVANGVFPTSRIFICGNQFESAAAPPSAMTYLDPNNGGGDGAGLTTSQVWVVDNRYYRAAASEFVAIGTATPANVDTITVTGNRGYGAATPGSPMTGINPAMGNATIADNLNQAYQAPPAFTGGER